MSLFYQIKQLKTEEEVRSFINTRLSELKKNELKVIGADTYNTVFSDLLDESVRVNATTRYYYKNGNLTYKNGSVKFDDDSIYRFLVEAVRNTDNIYVAIFLATRKYLTDNYRGNGKDVIKKRHFIYRRLSAPFNKTLSVKYFSKRGISACTELAGVAHNMFKFLDIDADYIASGLAGDFNLGSDMQCTEKKNKYDTPHCFNVIYPEGRNKYAIIYDTSGPISNYPMMYYLDERKKRELLTNKTVSVTEKDMEKAFKRLLKCIPKLDKIRDEYLILKDATFNTVSEYINDPMIKKISLLLQEEKK